MIPLHLQAIFLKRKLELIFETINYYYINFVLNYDLKKQIALVKGISNLTKIPRAKFNKNLLFIFSFVFITGFIGILLAKNLKGFKRLRKEEKLIKEFLRILETKGYRKGENEGLEEFALKIKEGNLRALTLEFVKIFEENYYKDKLFTKKELNKLREIINKLKGFS
ncbi:MAG: hypothetical protein C0169_04885 [Thermodesulfobacterium geofontis]|uniref:DUF4129 domain-containing protein n=1 Tax=Thermodesulfobacterium geofontis TaxID=1295609 RepID=A0A2N7QC01_9BACT|nr:MAG: hypothetical protein C0169_04885 [Thermodesulfobacterium geofontis]